MTRTLRRLLPILVVGSLVLAACGGGGQGESEEPATSEPAGSEPAASVDATAACEGVDSITFTHTMNDQESPVMAEIAEAFEGTTVEVTQIPFDGAQAAYDQQAAGGRPLTSSARRSPGSPTTRTRDT